MLTVFMVAVGRGKDIFNTFENLFEKTERTFNNINVNFPAIATTTLGTKILTEVVFGPLCPSFPTGNNAAVQIPDILEFLNLQNFGQIICDIKSAVTNTQGLEYPQCIHQLTDVDFCLIKLIFSSNKNYQIV